MTTPDPRPAARRRSGLQRARLPAWAIELIDLYESNAYSQFVLSGNVADRFVLHGGDTPVLRGLAEYLQQCLLPGFDVVLSYDLGNGIRVEKGEAVFREWPSRPAELPRSARGAIEALTHFFRYAANLARLGRRPLQVACVVRAADLVIPDVRGRADPDLGAIALLVRGWSREDWLSELPIATFLLAENRSDLHPLVVQNPRAAYLEIPMPDATVLEEVLTALRDRHPIALREYRDDLARPAAKLAGSRSSAVEALLKTREHREQPLKDPDLAELKRTLVERDCNGLIEFLEPDRSLDDYTGQPAIVEWLRGDLELWRRDELDALPMGYLLCGPVGTGKTFLVECLAGEAAVPVVKLGNFRDRWVGSTESNLERIFRLLRALGRCYVFVDEADQALGRRNAGSGDSGVSGRVYSMIADEMSDTRNRGRIVWILASSRPDLIEVDLKRPGRVDVKLPLLPAATREEGFALLAALCRQRGLELDASDRAALMGRVPERLTPGAAEALAVRALRVSRTRCLGPRDALADCLDDYRAPVPEEAMQFQIALAVAEASDPTFVPACYRADG